MGSLDELTEEVQSLRDEVTRLRGVLAALESGATTTQAAAVAEIEALKKTVSGQTAQLARATGPANAVRAVLDEILPRFAAAARIILTPWFCAVLVFWLSGPDLAEGILTWISRMEAGEFVKAILSWPVLALFAVWSLGWGWARTELEKRHWGPMGLAPSATGEPAGSPKEPKATGEPFGGGPR